MVCQDGGSTASNKHAAAFLCDIQNGVALCVKGHLAFRVECVRHADGNVFTGGWQQLLSKLS